MPAGHLSGVVHCLRRTALLSHAAAMTDGQVLERFIVRRDEAAFAELVRRHGAMVLAVCRRILGHRHDAEDAFQATFLVLIRKAATIGQRERVGNWLYGTAYRAAMEAKAFRRRCRERQVSRMPEPQTPAAESSHDLCAIFDEELCRLPNRYRTAIVLCEMEGRTRKEAARQLGIPVGTLSGRLTTARRRLARRLTRRGVVLTAGGLSGTLAAALAPNLASAVVPASLATALVQAAAAAGAGHVAAARLLPDSVLSLAEGVMKSMLLQRLRTLAVTILAAALLSSAGIPLAGSAWHAQPQQAEQNGQRRPAAASPSPVRDQELLQGNWVVVRGELGGVRLSDDQLENWKTLVFAGDQVTRAGGRLREGAYAISPVRRELDLFINGETLSCTYQLDGTTLTLASRLGDRVGILLVYVKEDSQEKAPTDKQTLQGSWIVKSGEKDGKKLNEFQLKNWERLTFDDDKIVREGGEKREGSYKLDPAKTPREIDLDLFKGGTVEGIYELKGNTLKLAIKLMGRPTEFNSKEGMLLVFEKEKKN
jgi:RNA polymerase sigma-70 factor (ECF subfamily)